MYHNIKLIMSTTIPSIYIPRVHNSVTWQEVKAVFEEVLGEDTIKRVDIVKIKPRDGQKSPPFNQAYVHIKKWLPDLNEIKDKLVSGGSFKIELPDDDSYRGPVRFWLCLMNKNAPIQEQPKGKPRIVMDNTMDMSPDETES